MTYYLEPRYCNQKSFYSKAIVIEYDNVVLLKSYDTIVGKITNNEDGTIYEYWGHYSATTTRHQKEFFKQYGLSDDEIKKLIKNGTFELKIND